MRDKDALEKLVIRLIPRWVRTGAVLAALLTGCNALFQLPGETASRSTAHSLCLAASAADQLMLAHGVQHAKCEAARMLWIAYAQPAVVLPHAATICVPHHCCRCYCLLLPLQAVHPQHLCGGCGGVEQPSGARAQ